MQAVAEVEEDHDESRMRNDKSQWRHDERGARRTLGEGMWSVSTAVRTRVTACGGRRRRRGGLSPRSTPTSRHSCSSGGGRVLAAVLARLHRGRSHLTHFGGSGELESVAAA